MDYNTQRPRLVLPEYGRLVQNMVDYAVGLTDRAQRQALAETIVNVMAGFSRPDAASPISATSCGTTWP